MINLNQLNPKICLFNKFQFNSVITIYLETNYILPIKWKQVAPIPI